MFATSDLVTGILIRRALGRGDTSLLLFLVVGRHGYAALLK